MLSHLLQVALGGALGASARYLVGLGTLRLIGPGFPWGTLTVNVVGSFAMGLLVVVLAEVWGNRFAPLLMTGLLGGFTTFSAFSLDAVALFERGMDVIPPRPDFNRPLADQSLTDAIDRCVADLGYLKA